ncbi:MAG: ATPase [Legionellales bacterium]|nr:ATPase [Legionellales bacterium]
MTIIASMKRLIQQQLLNWHQQKDRKPLILNGVRQCGKTYSLQSFGEQHFATTHYLNFELFLDLPKIFEKDLVPKRLVQEIGFYLNCDIDITRDLLIFDEIQACPAALTSLKYFNEQMPELALCSAGSLLGVTLNQGSFPVGQVNHLHLYPLDFIEFLLAIGEDKLADLLIHCDNRTDIPLMAHERLWERMKWYWIVGGLPEAVKAFRDKQDNLLQAFQAARDKQQDLIYAYFGDITKHAGKVNAMHIDRCWHAVSTQLASTQDTSAKRFQFKDIIPGIDRYSRLSSAIDWLITAGLIIKVPLIKRPELPLAAYADEARFKCFMFDIGILGAMNKITPQTILQYDFGTYKGYYAENFVAQNLLAGGQSDVYSWFDGRNEVEFVIDHENSILPLEVKAGHVTRAKSLSIYNDKYHPSYMTIASGHPLQLDNRNRIHRYPLYLTGCFPLPEADDR